MSGSAFGSVCYDTLLAAQQAACNDTAFWNNIPGQSVSCVNALTTNADGYTVAHLLVSDGQTFSYVDRLINFPSCVSFGDPFQIWSYFFASVVGLYLTTRMISVIIRMIK